MVLIRVCTVLAGFILHRTLSGQFFMFQFGWGFGKCSRQGFGAVKATKKVCCSRFKAYCWFIRPHELNFTAQWNPRSSYHSRALLFSANVINEL